MELFDDYRTKRLKNRIAGQWFPANRSARKRIIEAIGRGLAMTLRIMIRKNIGVESYTFWMVISGVLWIRLSLSIGAAIMGEAPWIEVISNPLPFYSIGTGILTVQSYLFSILCLWIFLRTELGEQINIRVDNRGESTLLNFLIQEDAHILLRKAFVQAVIAPVLGLIIATTLFLLETAVGLQIYLIGSSLALLIDEINYHRALIRLRRILVSKQNTGTEMMKSLQKLRSKSKTSLKIN